jgi:hypothetical protein
MTRKIVNTVEPVKPKRKPSEYNLFVASFLRVGKSMRDAANAWNRLKEKKELDRLKLRAALIIQRRWRMANCNTDFKMCRDRLKRLQLSEYNVFIRSYMRHHRYPFRMGVAPREVWTPPEEAQTAWAMRFYWQDVRQRRKEYEDGLAEFFRTHMASVLIQRKWRLANSNPSFKLCRDRLMNEFNSMA